MTSWANSGAKDLHLDLRVALTPGARGTKHALIAALREAVRSGRLAPGTALPPSRALAGDVGVARNTVADAYAELVAEGWLVSRQGAGTRVADTVAFSEIRGPSGRRVTPVHNLMPGSPDVAEFPRSQWLACTRRALAAAPHDALRMGDPQGRPELREVLAEYLTRARGVRASPYSVVLCSGVRQGVELAVRALGGPIAVEAYGLFLFRDAIAAMGVPTVPIGVDDRGAVVAELEDLPVSAALLTPAHHSPLGMALDPARRAAVVDWATRKSTFVLDDDYDGEFRYDRNPVGALQALAPERVVYLGSASKSLSPALRIGWMVVPDELVGPVVEAAGGQQYCVDAISALTLAEFVSAGHYDRHIRRMRLRYRRRRDALVTALSRFDVEVGGLAAGVSALVRLPEGSEPEVLRRAADAGIALTGLQIMRHPAAAPDVPAPDGLVVGFAAPAEHGFAAAVSALCDVLADSGL